MDISLVTCVEEAALSIRGLLGDIHPKFALILGSGLNSFAECLCDLRFLEYRDVDHMPLSTATGHKGRFVLGRIPQTDTWILCMQGRIHGYEGYTAQQVALPVWAMHAAGIQTLVTTNAAGAINPAYRVGDFCVMTDHMNFTGRNPVQGIEPAKIAQRFVPMLGAYDSSLRASMVQAAKDEDVSMQQGVYLALLGPSFETPAEIRCFAGWGADTVAMSVVEEVIAARHVDMRVVGLSMISNMACGVRGGDPTDEEILDVAVTCEEPFRRLIFRFAQLMDA